jgi:hypothetical protein
VKGLTRFVLGAALAAAATVTPATAADDAFVPFVIPAVTPTESLIRMPYSPIAPDGPHVTVRNGHFHDGTRRVRMWGVNLSFAANFPDPKDAPVIAERLAAAGVNSVRMHHMDTAWYPRGIWNGKDGKTITPEALERMDVFVGELAKRGIYINLNLHVGRDHSRYLGLPKAPENYDKITGIFTPELVAAQKQYARELLDRVNPHRGKRYAEDPAIAFVEITNEDSLFMWSAPRVLPNLPPHYNGILTKQFNAWLRKQYGDRAALDRTWASGAEPAGGNVLRNSALGDVRQGRPEHWGLEQHQGSRAELLRHTHREKPCARIRITKRGKTDWHLQFSQAKLKIEKGRYYTVRFTAAAEAPRPLVCSVGQAHESWQNLGLSRQVTLLPEWKTYRLGFTATGEDDNARVSFTLGGADATIYLSAVELFTGGQQGLIEGEDPARDNVALFAGQESPVRQRDRMVFLAETEKSYFDEMRRYIKKDLGCKALVTGTIVFGPLGQYGQSDMDFVDGHSYWQHPHFPGKPWDMGNWIVRQKSLVDNRKSSTLHRLAAERLAGKPFTVTEYNHPAPNDYQVECMPMLAAFAAAQDWDGLWLYSYSHSADVSDTSHVNSFFDIFANPAKWGFAQAGAAIFRFGAVPPLDRDMVVWPVGKDGGLPELAEAHIRYGRDMLGLLTSQCRSLESAMLLRRTSGTWRNVDGIASAGDTRFTPRAILWEKPGHFALRTCATRIEVGHATTFAEQTEGAVSVDAPDFAAITVTPLHDEPVPYAKRMLVTACGRCENTGMGFSDKRDTVGRNWGKAPVRIEAVTGSIRLFKPFPAGTWTCRALGPDGLPTHAVPLKTVDGRQVLELSPGHKTMWYLLERTR